MKFQDVVVPILVFAMVAVGAFAGLQVADAASDSAARNAVDVTNESINQQVGLWQFVNNATDDDTAGFTDNVTVYNASGAELNRGTDYEWNSTDGTITYFNTANVTDGNTGNITYTYYRNTQGVRVLSQPIDVIMQFVSRYPLMVGGFAMAIMLIALAALLARFFADSGPRRNR